MRMLIAAIVVLISYVIGTFPTALVVGRRRGFDPTAAGSGNPGASNAFRVGGKRAGVTVLLGDLLKGVIATGLGLVVGGRPPAMAAGVAAVVGHIAPVTRGFRGGKGVATASGMGVVLFPLVGLGLAAGWAALARLTGKASLASLAAVVAMVPAVAVIGRPGWEIASVGLLATLIVARHWGNLVRLLRGTERTLRGVQAG
ncbi:MAG: glycerol-3-phosphate acyltransferase [Acidimicrobiales bacterium]